MALNEKNHNLSRKELLSMAAMITTEILSSYSSSESDGDEDLLPLLDYYRRRKRRKVPRVENYVEVIVKKFNDSEFKSHFRIQRGTFEYVLTILAPTLTRTKPGTPMINPDKQLLIALWRMASPDSYRSICEKFNISRSTALYAVRRVTGALIKLAPALIRWPQGDQVESIWRGFEAISIFPKVIGAIDGKHINIPAPHNDPEAYVNRKGHHSIHLQGVCDHRARFTHVFVGHVGSVHDQRVFRQSDIQDFMGDERKFPANCHLVGDPAYKLHENLLVPYRDNGNLSERQKNFNFCLSSARIAIERAFGLLTARFRSLLTVLAMTKITEIPNFVLACCVLHNICSLQEDEIDFTLPADGGEHIPQIADEEAGAAVAKREYICETLPIRHV